MSDAPVPPIHEYAFDTKFFAAIRIKAGSPEEAATLLRERIDGVTAHIDTWPDGEPMPCEISLDGALALFEVNGMPYDGAEY